MAVDGCPMFGRGVHGPRRMFSNAFTRCTTPLVPKKKALEGLRPSSSAHVRWGEHGAPGVWLLG